MAHETVSERATRHLQRLAETRGFKTALAGRLHLKSAAITPYVKGERAVTVPMLEAMADISGLPIAELIAPEGSLVKQLDAEEASLLRWLRLWPREVRRSLLAFLRFFADEPSAEMQARNLHETWRHLRARDRDWLYGVAVLLQRGTLPPDLQAALVQELEAEQSRRRGRRPTSSEP